MWLGFCQCSQPDRRDRGSGFPRFPGARFPSVFRAAVVDHRWSFELAFDET
jgi:hypothetical protein